MANPWEMDWSQQRGQPIVTPIPASPKDQAREDRDNAAANRDDIRTGIAVRGEQRDIGYKGNDYALKIASDYNADPTVKAYRVAISQLGQALGTGDGPQADLALTYAFAKAMDPESVVRESEQGMVTESQPWFQSAVEKTRKQFGMDGAGNYTPETRQALRVQINNAVAQRAKVYDARRGYYEGLAQQIGVDPQVVLGPHDAEPFIPVLQNWVDSSNPKGGLTDEQQKLYDAVMASNPNATPEQLRSVFQAAGLGEFANAEEVVAARAGGVAPGSEAIVKEEPGFGQSPVGQGLYGVNEGIAGTLGLPIDALTFAMNLIPKGINAAANTDIPTIQDPVLGGDWFKDRFRDAGFIGPDAETGSGQFIRRAGQSLGAASVPGLGMSGSIGKAGTALLSGAGGGLGAATAQRVFPDSPLAEVGGELIGGGLGGLGGLSAIRSRAQSAVNAKVPTVQELKEKAAGLYRRAETRGATADPALTQQLADDMRQTLRNEGQIGPSGKITDADTSTTKAYNLINQYAGQPMRPTEMDTVRGVIAEGRDSMDKSDQRLAKIMLDQFDTWADPLAPEFSDARDVSSRYLQAQDLEQARELAGVRAGQFTGSGFENALRTEYRGLDRNSVKGRDWFSPDVQAAIETVSRGTSLSNAARNLGRFAPTGPVSAATGTGGAAGLGFMMGGPTGALIGGTGAAALGTAGRLAATKMGINNATRAELIARNGGPIAQVPLMDVDTERLIAALAAVQLGQHQNPTDAENQEGQGNPQPLAGRERQQPRRRGLFGS